MNANQPLVIMYENFTIQSFIFQKQTLKQYKECKKGEEEEIMMIPLVTLSLFPLKYYSIAFSMT